MRSLSVPRFLAAVAVAAFLCAEPGAAAPPAATAQPVGPAQPPSLTGTVLDTMDSGGYTYLHLKTPSGEVWAAVNKATVRKGSLATVVNPVLMENFESKTLKRKFDRIYFGTLGSGPSSAAQASGALPPGHPLAEGKDAKATMAAQHASAAAGPADVGPVKVAKATGAGARTVAEVFSQRAALKDSQVVVRGKVVKFLPNIMGKNWLHLRDGSGSPQKKDDDLTVTTKDVAAVGDVVTVTGTVRLDRDLGAGYSYPVLIEDARVSH